MKTACDQVRLRPLSDFAGLAEDIVESKGVISVFAACEWDCLNDDGKQWIAAIVRETIARTICEPDKLAQTGADPARETADRIAARMGGVFVDRREAELAQAERELQLARSSMNASSFHGRCRTVDAQAKVKRLRAEMAGSAND